ncbi:MAG: polymer-forming cytoskeletal protein [Lentisphaerae bacterium]|nr:polymer-forming cytoskeletal protein [Lentisphaerota bacterium]
MENNDTAKTVIAEDVEIVGSIKCSSNVQLDGKLNGDINCSGNAIIGKNANVKGNISVTSTTVFGQVNGNISAKDKIELKSSARITGDLRAKRLTIEDGVSFVGKSEVNASGSSTTKNLTSDDQVISNNTSSFNNGPIKDAGTDTKGKGLFGKK